jgi:hypothetical protein
MPAERVSMRHAREIICLKYSACVSAREIARAALPVARRAAFPRAKQARAASGRPVMADRRKDNWRKYFVTFTLLTHKSCRSTII